MKPNFVKYLFHISLFLTISIFFGCQKDSTFTETSITIENQSFTLSENSPAGAIIGQVEVKNASLSKLDYYLVSGDYSKAFRMENTTGKLILNDISLINFDAISKIDLEVMVAYESNSKGYSTFANVLINLEKKKETVTWTADVFSGKNQNALVNDLQPDSNMVQSNFLFASAWTVNMQLYITRSFLQFDLTSIPVDAQITGSTLSLYNPKDGDYNHEQSFFWGSNDFCIRLATSSWNSQTITWNNQPAFSFVGQVILPVSKIALQDYEKIDITEMVQYLVQYPDKNYGFIIMLNDENYYRRICFASLNHTDENLRPKLEITYLK